MTLNLVQILFAMHLADSTQVFVASPPCALVRLVGQMSFSDPAGCECDVMLLAFENLYTWQSLVFITWIIDHALRTSIYVHFSSQLSLLF